LVRRRRCASDRRVVQFALTGQGAAVAMQIPAILIEVFDQLPSGLTAGEVAMLSRLLRKMLTASGAAMSSAKR
jgi:DNA-binding MarR family transcriptional regulator